MISCETLFSRRFFTDKPGKSVVWIPFCLFLAVGCQFQDNRNLTGGYRLITFFGGRKIPVYLLTVFSKGERSDLSQRERNALAELTRNLAKSLGPRAVARR